MHISGPNQSHTSVCKVCPCKVWTPAHWLVARSALWLHACLLLRGGKEFTTTGPFINTFVKSVVEDPSACEESFVVRLLYRNDYMLRFAKCALKTTLVGLGCLVGHFLFFLVAGSSCFEGWNVFRHFLSFEVRLFLLEFLLVLFLFFRIEWIFLEGRFLSVVIDEVMSSRTAVRSAAAIIRANTRLCLESDVDNSERNSATRSEPWLSPNIFPCASRIEAMYLCLELKRSIGAGSIYFSRPRSDLNLRLHPCTAFEIAESSFSWMPSSNVPASSEFAYFTSSFTLCFICRMSARRYHIFSWTTSCWSRIAPPWYEHRLASSLNRIDRLVVLEAGIVVGVGKWKW